MASRKFNLENKAGLSDELIGLLADDFKSLKKINSGLPDRVLRYVVDGEGDSVLTEIENNDDFALTIGLVRGLFLGGDQSEKKESPRKLFFQNTEVQDAELLLRLAKVYQAGISNYYVQTDSDGVPAWLDTFMTQATQFTIYQHPPKWQTPGVKAETVGKMLTLDGYSPSALVEQVFLQDARWNADTGKHNIYTSLPGYNEFVVSYPEPIVESLTHKRVQQKVYALKLIKETGASIEPFAQLIIKLALSNSSELKHGAMQLIEKQPDAVIPHLLELLNSGTPDERASSVTVIHDIMGDKSEQILRDKLEREKSQKVIEQIKQCLGKTEKSAEVPTTLELPPLAVSIESKAPLSAESLEHLKKALNRQYSHRKETAFELVFDLIQGISSEANNYRTYEKHAFTPNYSRPKDKCTIDSFVQLPDVQLIHVIRLLFLIDEMRMQDYYEGLWVSYEPRLRLFRKNHPEVGLREVAAALSLLDVPQEEVGWKRVQWYLQSFVWEDEATWPYFVENIHILEQGLGLKPLERNMHHFEKGGVRKNCLDVLCTFPTPPEQFIPYLWDIALGTAKSEKPDAMKCLAKLPDTGEKLIQALRNGKQDARASAAEWLAQMDVKEAIPEIEAALKKEKSENARIAMMTALESFGIPLENYLDLKGLTAEAEAGLKKGIPEQLSWFQFDNLPAVHWQDSGNEVPKEIIRWWIVNTNKLNNPEPGPLLRRYCSMIAKEDREALGTFVLSSWIEQDTIPTYTYEEASKTARKNASQSLQWYKQIYPDMTLEKLEKSCLNDLLSECKGSAIKEKGIMALAASCGGSNITPLVEAYLKRWYGQRAAQCRALVKMLSWIEDNSAIQLLLATSVRFRTKSIREEAEACVNALAERKGWTVEELADRTIPTVGFDEGPEMVLDYGMRTFTARFDSNFEIIVRNEDGEVIKSLPDARKDDDEEKVKEAKWKLSNAKKELKTVLKLQKERLYEAMCTQRTWTFADWNTYLNNHPLVKYYCQNLVWQASEDGKQNITFRPLDDGTLTDHEDNEVSVAPNAIIRLAHACTVPEETGKAWINHFKDYELTQVFDQFSRPVYVLPEDKKEETQLTDREGYMIESFKLRSMATKLGYTREKSEEGGWFYEYSKIFPGLGLSAVISFTGSELPETNKPVALTELCFRKRMQNGSQESEDAGQVPLGEVPLVLITECWNDICRIAAEGSGFNKDWEQLVE